MHNVEQNILRIAYSYGKRALKKTRLTKYKQKSVYLKTERFKEKLFRKLFPGTHN